MEENNNQQPQYQQPQYQQPQQQYQYKRGTSARAAISLVLGIISIVLSLITYNGWSSGIVLTCGVLAMFLGYGEARFLKSGVAKAGFICGIIGISIFVLKIVATLFLQLFYSVM